MEPRNTSKARMLIANPKTGEETEFKGIQPLTITTDKTVDDNLFPACNQPTEFNATMDVINAEALNELLYNTLAIKGTVEEIARGIVRLLLAGYTIARLYFWQIRTHKKKRINKKWAKKYGYACKVYYYKDEGGE